MDVERAQGHRHALLPWFQASRSKPRRAAPRVFGILCHSLTLRFTSSLPPTTSRKSLSFPSSPHVVSDFLSQADTRIAGQLMHRMLVRRCASMVKHERTRSHPERWLTPHTLRARQVTDASRAQFTSARVCRYCKACTALLLRHSPDDGVCVALCNSHLPQPSPFDV